MLKYLKDVKRVTAKAEKKEPEFVFYDVYKSKVNFILDFDFKMTNRPLKDEVIISFVS